MINKIAAAIGGGGSGSYPPPPPVTATNIVFTPTTNVKPSSYVEQRQFGLVLKHQFEVVNQQVQHGLLHVKRTCAFVEAILKCLDHSSDARKLTSELTAKWQDEPLHDEMTHFSHASAMIGEVMLHTYNAHEKFRRAASTECVQPLHAFYKASQAKRKDLTKEHAKMLSTWNSIEEQLTKDRRECSKAYTELRLAQDARDKEESSETSQKDLYPKLVKKWKEKKETAVKKFQLFEKSVEKARTLQDVNDTTVLPGMLNELEQIERERLTHMTDYMMKFQQLFMTWSAEIKSSSDLINKVTPALHADKAITTMLDKFTMTFGPPPTLVPVRFDLPCTSASINSDQLPSDSAPLLAYLPGMGPPPPAAIPQAATRALSPTPVTTPPASSSTATPSRTQISPASPTPPPVTRALPVPAVRALPQAVVRQTSSTASVNATAITTSPPPSQPSAISPPSSATPPATPTAATISTPSSTSTAPTPTPKPTVAVGVFSKNSRAPPPILPTKRKPKGEINPADLPAPPLPPPVTIASPSYRASVSHRSSIMRPSMSMNPGVARISLATLPPPPLPPSVIASMIEESEVSSPSTVAASATMPTALETETVAVEQIHAGLRALPARPSAASTSLTVPGGGPPPKRLSIFGVSLDETPANGRLSVTRSAGPPPLPTSSEATSSSTATTTSSTASESTSAEFERLIEPQRSNSVVIHSEHESSASETTIVDDESQPLQSQYAEALYDFQLNEDTPDIHYLTFEAGDTILVYQATVGDDWWYGQLNEDVGFFAANYVKLLESESDTQ